MKEYLKNLKGMNKMDLFKKANIKDATAWDWNCPLICRRNKNDTQKLHRHSRRKLKRDLAKEINELGENE